jgi:hypothetical protein
VSEITRREGVAPLAVLVCSRFERVVGEQDTHLDLELVALERVILVEQVSGRLAAAQSEREKARQFPPVVGDQRGREKDVQVLPGRGSGLREGRHDFCRKVTLRDEVEGDRAERRERSGRGPSARSTRQSFSEAAERRRREFGQLQSEALKVPKLGKDLCEETRLLRARQPPSQGAPRTVSQRLASALVL